VYDHDRFLEYVKLPREVPYLRDEVRQQLPRGDHLARLDQDFGLSSLPPIVNEEPLVRTSCCGSSGRRQQRRIPALAPGRFPEARLREAKLVHGVGDPQQWSPLLLPDEYQSLQERVDLEFAPDNPEVIGIDDP